MLLLSSYPWGRESRREIRCFLSVSEPQRWTQGSGASPRKKTLHTGDNRGNPHLPDHESETESEDKPSEHNKGPESVSQKPDWPEQLKLSSSRTKNTTQNYKNLPVIRICDKPWMEVFSRNSLKMIDCCNVSVDSAGLFSSDLSSLLRKRLFLDILRPRLGQVAASRGEHFCWREIWEKLGGGNGRKPTILLIRITGLPFYIYIYQGSFLKVLFFSNFSIRDF